MRKELLSIVLAGAAFYCVRPTVVESQVDYPHLKLGGEGLSAPDCNNVPKLLVGGVRGCSPEEMQTWLNEMRGWRTNRHIRMGYSDEMYNVPALKWTQSSFIQPQMMMEDRYFYDPVAGKYTVDRYVDDTVKRYGGIDSILIWHTYTNIGVDDRNQYDLIRDMPGDFRPFGKWSLTSTVAASRYFSRSWSGTRARATKANQIGQRLPKS